MLENGDDGQHMDSESESGDQPEIDLLEQLNRLTIKDSSPMGGGGLINVEEGMDGAEESLLNADEQVIAKASARVLQRSNPVFNLKRPSSKMTRVLETIRERILKSGDKAIIVSQWTSVLDILRTHLENDGVSTLSLNGTIPVKLRQNIVSEFNDPRSSKRILLLSLTAGGVGLNLIGANHLLLIDLHWNPQLEAQAQDRIYRVGQKKDVTIYKFMCKDTVEERIKRLQDVKLDLANGVLTGSKGGSKLTIDDLRSLFDV